MLKDTYQCQLYSMKACRELWKWIFANSGKKHEWPGWEKFGKAKADCPACEHAALMWSNGGDGGICDYCFLRGIAWDEYCLEDPSLFLLWENSSSEIEAKYYASWMVFCIEEAIENFKRKECLCNVQG